jgi:hypothetical protein
MSRLEVPQIEKPNEPPKATFGPGMVNVKKNYVINGKISYLMIIFDYHYQIKINVNFSHGLS